MKPKTTLTKTDSEILQAVQHYHFLTASQLCRLKYSSGSLTMVQSRLKALANAGYLLRRYLPYTAVGHPTFLYTLSTTGKRMVADDEDEVTRVRKSEIEEMSYFHLSHVIQLNDVLISAELLSRSTPELTLKTMVHDLELKKTPIQVSYECFLPNSKRVKETATVIPDAWVDWRYTPGASGKEKRRVFCIELDRGSIDQNRIKRKFRAYCEVAVSDAYVNLFHTELCQVVYICLTPARRDQLVDWLEEELTLQGLEDENNLFRVGCPETLENGRDIFLESCFLRPFDEKHFPLLWPV